MSSGIPDLTVSPLATTATVNQSVPSGLTPAPKRSLSPFIWDGIAVVVSLIVGAAYLVSNDGGLRNAWWFLSSAVLATAAIDVTLRIGQPNLAISSIGSIAGIVLAKTQNNVAVGLFLGLLCTLIIGAVFAVLVGPLHLPAWAVSFAFITAASAIAGGALNSGVLRVDVNRDLFTGAVPLVVGLVICVAIGALTFSGRSTSPADSSSAKRPSTLVVAAAMMLSCLIAGLLGMSQVIYVGAAIPGGEISRTLFIALVASVVGGTSPRGSRAGILGPTFAAVTLGFLSLWLLRAGWDGWRFEALLAVLLTIGLVAHAALDYGARSNDKPPAFPQ